MNKTQVAKYFEVEPGAVVKFREVDEGATIYALINYGIGGIKVFRTPIEDFAPPKPKPEPEPELLPVPAAYDLDDDDLKLSYKQLQGLAKEAGIRANQRAAELRAALEEEE